ncbi:hypothetical protein PTTG_26349 [Puccinia triticina 1-1 BBBD Race 1]|uniref:Uncharacterized protein n=1 Tax=Puccinia triticina (isolate 1-1 / race 1 (BBBD)) TaxID=630390 RepID=A0A180GX68_PUCT1|nr:hypothetical protein PTTG_26349 [Puccinia triticina 1-1 BBBD Race 1]
MGLRRRLVGRCLGELGLPHGSRKIPAPRLDLPNSWISMSLPTTHLQLNEAGRSLGIEDFLSLCNVPKEDHLSRRLIKLSHINRWDYFLDVSSHKLEKLKFPHPLASQLMKGATWLIPTHTIADDNVASPKKERGPPVQSPTHTGTPDGPLVGLTSGSTSVRADFATPATPITPHGPAEPARTREEASDPKDATSDESQPSHSAILQSEVAPSQEF